MPKKKSARKRVSSKSNIAKPSSRTKPQPIAERPFAPGYGLATDTKGLLSWDWVAKKFGGCRTYWLSTIHANEPRPHVMPIWGVWVDDEFFFSTGRKSRKGQNLASNPSCTVANDDGQEAVIMDGHAEQATDAASLERMAAAYKKKYKMDPRSMGEPIYLLRPKTVFGFVEKTFPQSATRWRPGLT